MTPLEELRHSASHILATALLRIFPDAKLDIGPPTDTGFYYDIDLDHTLTTTDLVMLETEMRKIEELEHDATKGDSSAQYSLAIHYLHGFGCETNEVLGIFWLSKAAAQGNIDASNDLQAIESPSTNSASLHRN